MIIMHYCASYWTHQQIIGRDEHSKMNENQCAGPWTFSCNRMQWNIIYYWVGGSVKVVSSAASSRKRWREKIMRERESKIAESEKKSWTEGYIACNGPINNYRSVMPDTMSAYLFSDDYSVSMACLSTIKIIICTANVPQLKGIWVIPTRRIPITSELHTLRTWFWCRTELPCL